MTDKVRFEIATPERLLVTAEADMVVIPGAEGNFGVLPGHAPMLSTVRPGVVDVYEGNTVRQRVFVAGGFAEVRAERCIVLAEEAVPVEDIDTEAAGARLERASAAINAAETDADRKEAEGELAAAEGLVAAAQDA
jgi:F-type H+-transporting ATPase subunit epsilon